MKKADIFSFFHTLESLNPNPESELVYTNPYTLLVAVILSAQSTDKGVNKATESLFKKIKTPEDMLLLGEDNLKDYIKTIGLYKSKAKNIIKCSQQLIEKFKGQVPSTKSGLESLAGVGSKTANVLLNVVFDRESFPVDTHVFRVCNRTGLAKGKNPSGVEEKLEKIVPTPYRKKAHHWLILHGRYTCKARQPLCHLCPVSSVCDYFKKESASFVPVEPNKRSPV
ncbi:MAG: endonuclease III [Alphaproteobacteria bacterium]